MSNAIGLRPLKRLFLINPLRGTSILPLTFPKDAVAFDAMDKLPLESTLKLSESMTRGDLPVILLVLTPDVVKCPNEAVAVAEPLSMLLV